MTVHALTTSAAAAEALERLAVGARTELLLCLPQLSAKTPLTLPALRDNGLATWADLLSLLSRRGPTVRILMEDTDPLMNAEAHRAAWARASGLAGALQGGAQFLCAPHGQNAGALWRWRLRKQLRTARTTLKAEDPAQLTPIQRAGRPVLRPATIAQAFAVADGQGCVIGAPGLASPPGDTPAFALDIADADFAGALRAHFADTWADALAAGGHSLAAPATALETHTRPQSRDNLRLLRTRALPAPGLLPRAVSTDLATALPRRIAHAERLILIRTAALRDTGLTRALSDAATRAPELQLVLIQRPDATDDSWDDHRATALRDSALASLRAAYGARLASLADPAAAGTFCTMDHRWTLMGSAPLTRRALRVDTHAAALADNPELAATLARALAALCLGPGTELPGNAATWQAGGAPLEPGGHPQTPRSPLPDDLF